MRKIEEQVNFGYKQKWNSCFDGIPLSSTSDQILTLNGIFTLLKSFNKIMEQLKKPVKIKRYQTTSNFGMQTRMVLFCL